MRVGLGGGGRRVESGRCDPVCLYLSGVGCGVGGCGVPEDAVEKKKFGFVVKVKPVCSVVVSFFSGAGGGGVRSGEFGSVGFRPWVGRGVVGPGAVPRPAWRFAIGERELANGGRCETSTKKYSG